MKPPHRENLSLAEEAYARYLEAQEDGGGTFGEFCQQHPELADELRRIRGALAWADDLLEREDPERDVAAMHEFRAGDDRYEILGEVARGGMGIVLRVFDRDLRRTLAMKVLHSNRSARRRAVARFLEEAQVTGQLEHPSIVPIYDVGALGRERIFYTMPLIRGQDLGEVFECVSDGRDGWNLTRALGILLRVAEAVSAAHARGVLHRDLKPANVMVGAHGEVYVMDWGLARILASEEDDGAPALQSDRQDAIGGSPDSSVGTVDGQVLGTPSFMSPEQARGEGDSVGLASDVYSAGAMLYLLLSGMRPYDVPGEQPRTEIVLQRLLEGPPPPLHTRAPRAPAELAAICDRAMARDPGDRYPDMGAFAHDLRAYLEQRVVSAYRTGAWAELTKWIQRNRALALAIGALFVTILAAQIISLSLKAEADANAAMAEESAFEATAHFNAAMNAIDRALTQVARDDLRDVPGAQAARLALLEDARVLYEALLEDRPRDVNVRWRTCRAQMRLADIYFELHDTESSTRLQARGLAEMRAIRAEHPGYPRVHRELAIELAELSKSHSKAHRHEEARASLQEALELVVDLLAEQPDDEELRRQHGAMISLMGLIWMRDDPPQAEPWLASAVEELDAYLARSDTTEAGRAFARSKLGETLQNQSTFFMMGDRLEEARVPVERTVGMRELDLARDKGNRLLRADLAGSLRTLGILEVRLEPDSALAQGIFERVIELWRDLYADFPNIAAYGHQVGLAHGNLAGVYSARGEHTTALETIEEALHWTGRALEKMPDEEDIERYYAALYQNLYWFLNVAGRHAEIAERIPEVVAIDADQAVPYWRTGAVAWAYCATNVMNDESLAPEEREALQEDYLLEMARYYREMADRGYVDPAHLDQEWFDGVRDHPLVLDLRAELEDREASGE